MEIKGKGIVMKTMVIRHEYKSNYNPMRDALNDVRYKKRVVPNKTKIYNRQKEKNRIDY